MKDIILGILELWGISFVIIAGLIPTILAGVGISWFIAWITR
jgi:hypothetical protein